MESDKIFECDFGSITASINQNDNKTVALFLSYNGHNIMEEIYPNDNTYDDKIVTGTSSPYKITKTNNCEKTIIAFYLNDEVKAEIGINHHNKRISYVADISKKIGRGNHGDGLIDIKKLIPHYSNDLGSEEIYVFPYTGTDQSFLVPTNAKYIITECWGAGGATQGYGAVAMYNTGNGGGGGYTKAKLENVAGQTLNVVVGGGGTTNNKGANSNMTYGNGGGQSLSNDANWGSASGGGRSSVQMVLNGVYQDIVTAGGGGAGGGNTNSGTSAYYGMGSGGPGGGSMGGNAEQNSGLQSYGGGGGTQTNGGTNGIQSNGTTAYVYDGALTKGGGGSQYGSGGGSGYYGGGYGGIISFSGLTENSNDTTTPALPSAGMVLWLDASVSSSIQLNSSGGVSQWTDQSPSAANAIPFTGTCGYNKTGLNNLPGVTMNDASLYLPLAAGTFTNGVTFFVVFSCVGNQQSNALISRTDASKTNYPGPWDMYNQVRYVGNNSTNGIKSVNSSNTFSTTINPSIYTFQTSSTVNMNEWFNGLNNYNSNLKSYYQDTGNYIYIGTRGDKATSFNGVISEIIVYNTLLSTDQVNSVNGYLAVKWGINITDIADSSTTVSTTSSTYWVFGGGGGGSSYVNSTYANTLSLEQAENNNVAGASELPSDVTGTIGNGGTATNAIKGGSNGQNGYVVIKVGH